MKVWGTKMKIVILEAKTIGEDIDMTIFNNIGETVIYDLTKKEELKERLQGFDVAVINKSKFDKELLSKCKDLKLICVTATGYDNIDVEYCSENGIAVCNVPAYSTESVAQVTAAMALSLSTNLFSYKNITANKTYTKLGAPNILTPVFHEISGKTWGIVGYGNIGKQVEKIAIAMGCKTLFYKKTPIDDEKCVDLKTLCENSDIISVHTPLSQSTYKLISRKMIELMKKDAILINTARGAVVDEGALAEAILEGKIAGAGVDVYSQEPYPKNSPMAKIAHLDNVCLTPHMAWGAYESRYRCMTEVYKNVEAFKNGEIRNRLDV